MKFKKYIPPPQNPTNFLCGKTECFPRDKGCVNSSRGLPPTSTFFIIMIPGQFLYYFSKHSRVFALIGFFHFTVRGAKTRCPRSQKAPKAAPHV